MRPVIFLISCLLSWGSLHAQENLSEMPVTTSRVVEKEVKKSHHFGSQFGYVRPYGDLASLKGFWYEGWSFHFGKEINDFYYGFKHINLYGLGTQEFRSRMRALPMDVTSKKLRLSIWGIEFAYRFMEIGKWSLKPTVAASYAFMRPRVCKKCNGLDTIPKVKLPHSEILSVGLELGKEYRPWRSANSVYVALYGRYDMFDFTRQKYFDLTGGTWSIGILFRTVNYIKE